MVEGRIEGIGQREIGEEVIVVMGGGGKDSLQEGI